MTDTSTYNATESNSLRARLIEAMAAQTGATLVLCKLLFESYYGSARIGNRDIPLAVAWGHENWDEYVEHELGIHMGTAASYVHVYDELMNRRQFGDGELPNSITKLKLLARLSRKKGLDIHDWAKKSKAMSCCELQAEVDALGGKGVRRRTLAFYMQWNAASKTMSRLKSAKESLGASTNGEALAKIVEQWSDLNEKTSRIRTIGKKAG
jgi:hypothetical protein